MRSYSSSDRSRVGFGLKWCGLSFGLLMAFGVTSWASSSVVSNPKLKDPVHEVEAWKIEKGSREIVIAVVDTGVDVSHHSLAQNIWNGSRVANRKISGDTVDGNGHGTHIAGIIGAIANPDNGVAGVAQNISILPVKFFSDPAPDAENVENSGKAIERAVAAGARVINYSAGGVGFSQEEYEAIKKASEKGVLFISAAGNQNKDTDKAGNEYFPAAYHLPNMITVGAVNDQGELASFSNYGKRSVDVAAPGVRIMSTFPGNRYGVLSGTSQATAYVTGIAALLLSKDPSLTPSEVRDIIEASVDKRPQLARSIASSGVVNAEKALVLLKNRMAQKQLSSSRLRASAK